MPIKLKQNLKEYYDSYVKRNPTNIVPGTVNNIADIYATGFTRNMTTSQFLSANKGVQLTTTGKNITITSDVSHKNYSDGREIKTFKKNLFSTNNRYGTVVSTTDISTSPLTKYAITQNSKSPLLRQYSKFNLRNDSPGSLEPFILRGIQRSGKSQEPQRWGIGGSGIGAIDERAALDVVRLSKFALTPNGIKFGINKAILQLYKETRPYDKGATLKSKPPFFEVKKAGRDFRLPPPVGYNNKKLSDLIPAIPGVGILDTRKTDSYATSNTIKEFFGIKKQTDIDGIYVDEDLYQNTLNNSDLIPIGFDRLGGNKSVFRGTISGIADSFSPSWESYQYLGRPDKVYNYTGMDRSLAFTFEVYVHHPRELKAMFRKLDFLSKLTMPKMTDTNRMIGPLIKLTIGELYKGQLGFISSLNISPNTDIPFDLGFDDTNTKRIRNALPKAASVNIGFQFIHNTIPTDNQGFRSYSDSDFLLETPTVSPITTIDSVSGGSTLGLPGGLTN